MDHPRAALIVAAAGLLLGACGGAPRRHAVGNAATLDGVYRNTITVTDYVAAGVDKTWATANAGIHTMTLRHGRARDEVRGPAIPVCDARYSVHARTIKWKFDGTQGCTGYFTATWSLHGGELRFTAVKADDAGGRAEFGLKPFRKIG